MSDLNVALAAIGGLTLALSLGTAYLRNREYLPSEPILAVGFGVLLGPHGVDAFGLSAWGEPIPIVGEVARFTVALAVTSIALRLPENYFGRRLRSMATLLGPGLLVMWLISGLLTYAFLPVPFPVAMLVGAIVTPTDPVLANSIVVGGTAKRHIPKRIRFLLSGEAGANDGGAYPLVFLAILLLGGSTDAPLAEWATRIVLRDVLGAIAIGLLIGGGIGRMERWSSEREYLEGTSVFTITVALTFTVLGVVAGLGLNDILAVFVAGIAYNWQADPRDEAREQRVEEVFNRLFTIPIFVLFGTVLPWTDWLALGWRGPALVVCVLILRRIPMVIALRSAITPLDRPAATLFVGWFGPIGIAAILYATIALHETGIEYVWTVVSLVVAGSILAHGATSTVLTHRYGRLDDDEDRW